MKVEREARGAVLRVAAYCRVSTDREDQANSLQSQRTYFEAYIQNHPGWQLAKIFADEGTSGTSTRRREAFNCMVREAEAGRIDLILTKEVSRFARNTVDTLEFTRRLKRRGVGVLFINDNIDTRDNDGELRLTIMASMAQEESRKTSERVKWGQRRRMEAGVVFGNDSTYGYSTSGGRLSVRPEEAEVVRRIYHKFLDEGKGTHVIARELWEEGVPPPRSSTGRWSCVMVRRILRNEKYAGDLLQKKYVTTDYLTHRKVENRGLEEQIRLRDHHEAVVDRPTWEAAQAELARRAAGREDNSRYSNRYWCSGKVRCGACGARFVPRSTKRSDGSVYRLWGCHSRVHHGKGEAGCTMRMVNHKSLNACARAVLEWLELDWGAAAAALAEELRREEDDQSVGRLEGRRADLEIRKERAMDACFAGAITREELLRMKARYDGELERLAIQERQREEALRLQAERGERLSAAVEELGREAVRSEEVFSELVERVDVYQTYLELRVRFLPFVFRVCYSTSGAGEGYATTIERLETRDAMA